MRKVERGELLPLAGYEQIRERFRARIVAEKKVRRVALGPHVTALFENHDTALLQIQEMLRTERISREDAVQHELDTYNELVPGDNELSATLFVEIPDKDERERALVELAGLEARFAIEIDGRRFPGKNETRGVLPDRTTAVHYVKFPIDAAASAAVAAREARAALLVDHPRYDHRAELSPATLESLSHDAKPGA
jgi:hypothetical protein